ncbi:LAMI_0E03334g1_1 [Lachancea mirantina]|uniref:LAMI_0E03334g1_1 n=1 Tax=Lachancea mirantina TaxID=1230905 RepID=A0A1G4JJM2_9SACH|nr:LAMI_0E03334g1_1 [Lachancea mirantina]
MQGVLTDKHSKFLKRHLGVLPSRYQEHDANKLSIVGYSLLGLSCLSDEATDPFKGSRSWLRRHYRTGLFNGKKIGGFCPSQLLDVENATSISLPNTLFALWSFICLKDTTVLTEIDRVDICRFVSMCQSPNDGSFVGSLDVLKESTTSPTESNDSRMSYIAVVILYLLGLKTPEEMSEFIDIRGLVEYLKTKCCINGGFGEYGEAHAGYTSCALSVFAILKTEWHGLSETFLEETLAWLKMRQVSSQGCHCFQNENEYFDAQDNGGFQGRENKFADSCYVFWCLNSIRIIEETHTNETERGAMRFLLERTQNSLIGGFSKNDEEEPDLYHTCMSLAAIGLMTGKFNGPLFLPTHLVVAAL